MSKGFECLVHSNFTLTPGSKKNYFCEDLNLSFRDN